MRLLLVRHGETDWNVAGRYQGHTDQPLNARGRQQAALLARRLAQEPVAEIYSSDLCRATQTAAAIAPAQVDPRLRELSFGSWEGLTAAQIGDKYPQSLSAWIGDPLNAAPHGGESLHQLGQRLQSFLQELERAHDRTVLLIAHGGSLRAIICLALGLPLTAYWRFRLDPTSVSELELTGEGATLVGLNDSNHLRGDANVCNPRNELG
jgi:alpha-ribazole phosphatase